MDKILIIEDDYLISYDLSQFLIDEKFNVTISNTYIDALETLNTNHFDLIICDINLGQGKNGIDLMNQVQEIKGEIFPFIYLTAYSDNEILEKATYSNPVNYILKPWTKTQLLIAVKLALKQSKIKSILQKNYNELNVLYSYLENKFLENTKLTSIALHDLRSPINFLHTFINQMINNLSNSNILENLKILDEISVKVSSLSDDIFNWIKYSNDKIKPNIIEINISFLLNQMIDDYYNIINVNNNKIILEIQDNIFIKSDFNMLKVIIRNILDNASKYTLNGQISIILFSNSKGVILNLKNLNSDPLSKTQIDSKNFNNSGLGLKIIDDFSKILNIDYTYNSNDQDGFIFTLTFN